MHNSSAAYSRRHDRRVAGKSA